MKVKVTNVMAKLMGQLIAQAESVKVLKMTPEQYERMVDCDLFRNEDDFDFETRKFKVIRIEYKADLCALPYYVTTRDLVRLYRNGDKTYGGFCEDIKAEYAV